MTRNFLKPIILIMMLALLSWPLNKSTDALEASEPVSSITRHLEYNFTIWNTTGLEVKCAELWVCAPVKETQTQKCMNLTASYRYDLIVDESGAQILHFTFPQLAPYDSRIINIGADLTIIEKPKESSSGKVIYLSVEKYCESNDEKIIKLAGQLKNKNPQETARTIYKWVSGNLRYSGYAKDPKGARYALETKEGDCTEYMYLFVALCRANQIPARGVGGFICRQNSLLRPEAYHNWAEFYYNKAWRLTDPQNKVFMEDEGDYIAMRYAGILKGVPISDDGMFGFAGEGIKAKMN